MANVWRKDDNVKEQPKRNIMDLTFQNNLTTQFGKLVPVFCKEFIPGDSFSIQPTFSLKFQPMVFPIQTRMRAHLHFFKVRNRNLWKDWEDFIAKNKENLDPPYLDTAITKPTTGSLLDYLGVPTTIVGSYGNYQDVDIVDKEQSSYLGKYAYSSSSFIFANGAIYFNNSFKSDSYTISKTTLTSEPSFTSSPVQSENYPTPVRYVYYQLSDITSNRPQSMRIQVAVDSFKINNMQIDEYLNQGVEYSDIPNYGARYKMFHLLVFSGDDLVYDLLPNSGSGNNGKLFFDLSSIDYSLEDLSYYIALSWFPIKLTATSSEITNCAFEAFQVNSESNMNSVFKLPQYIGVLSASIPVSAGTEITDIDDSNSPYWRSGATTDLRERIKLSALPCRAYEQIYNSFYRNAENNPYILNGVPEYNKYMPTDEGGVDANLYDFYYRNWEDDFLTTALQQPQAGIAPLVGLTGTAGTATVTLADEDGNTSEATASYDEEGNVTSVAFANNTSLTEALADAVQYGISINDLRNVNAFQRWLEAKARGGYKYRDVIETMFGITVRYDTLDMPEFIGGTSVDVFVNQISQTVPTETSPLGDYAGQASAIGTGQTINEYFDEHGFIIGILSVVPVPNYSQLLPKHFIKRDAFDYYFPQFGHIGMQPIKYDEVCPVQAYQESTDQSNVLEETFGYQRAWYDYLASTDEVHGEFRTNLRNFVMNRTFDVKPELVNDFLTVDPSQLNDVFAIEDDSYDKILGQIYFDVKAKRPIPLYGIPKLE